MQIFIYPFFCLFVTLYGHTNACAEWTLLTKPVIFGQSAKLSCAVDCDSPNFTTPTWTGGKNYSTLAIYGKSTPKYEVTNSYNGHKFQSILEIKDFNENDVNCDYSCSVGFNENRRRLELTKEDFVLLPSRTDKSLFSVFRNHQLDVQFEIRRVFPLPACNILFNGVEIKKRMETHVGMNGIFYSISEKIHHDFNDATCKGHLKIFCNVGATNMTFEEQRFDSCPEKIFKSIVDNSSITIATPLFIGLILGGILLIIVAIALLSMARYNKLTDIVCCRVSWKGEQQQQPDIAAIGMELKNLLNAAENENNQ